VKSPIAGLFLALSITALAASAAPAPPPKLTKWQQLQLEKFKHSAPADEYFGRTKMSYLGMNNTFRDSAISSGEHTTDPAIINKVTLAEEALEAWARKYPSDPQLARTYFLATQVERKIWVKGNQERAWIYLNRLVKQFPDTFFGKTLKRDLAIGFTEHYYALPVPCATPSPEPTATPTGATAPNVVATDTPAPAPTPSPGPTETTLARGLKVQIIPQPCVPAPTPSPSPSPSSPSSASSLSSPASLSSPVPPSAGPSAINVSPAASPTAK
jgi:hypothetical protein